MNLLDLLINKTVRIAIEEGILKSKTIILDATHTRAKYNQKSAREELLERAKLLRKEVYAIDESVKDKFPKKVASGILEDVIEYCEELSNTVSSLEKISLFPKVKERLNYLIEGIKDDTEELKRSEDEDAKLGHKTADSSFFGYKSHLAMSDERIITGAVITTGEKADGKYLEELVGKSEEAGMEVEEILADAAYSGKDNIEFTKEKEIKLISKLNPSVSKENRKKEDEFEFNKDAGMFICPAGHIAIRKAKQGKKNQNKNQATVYYFDVEKCKRCSKSDGCYKKGTKSKSYSISIKSDLHSVC